MDDFKEVLEFFRTIAFPRATGTEGDQKVQTLIRTQFSKIENIKTGEQEFSISRLYMSGVLNLMHPLIGILMLTSFGLALVELYIWAFIFTIVLLLVSIFNRQVIWALQFRIHQYGDQIPARNLWFSLDPSKEIKQNIVFLSHYDSISHKLSPILEAVGYLAGFLGGLAFSIHLLFYVIPIIFLGNLPGNLLQLIWGIPVACFTLIELFNSKGNKSDGAIDNASAVAQGYHLMKSLSKKPLKNTRIFIVATGAEEWGDYGAYFFIKENPCHLSKEDTRFIVVDGIGTDQIALAIYGVGLPVRHWSLFLEDHARELIQRLEIPCKMQAIPPLLQVASDHVPVENAGFEFIWFASNSFTFHTAGDTYEKLHKENFQQICEFLVQYIRRIDSS